MKRQYAEGIFSSYKPSEMDCIRKLLLDRNAVSLDENFEAETFRTLSTCFPFHFAIHRTEPMDEEFWFLTTSMRRETFLSKKKKETRSAVPRGKLP